jgi:hypothetical protein
MIIREEVPLNDQRRPQNGLFKSSSFWDLARTVEANAPDPNYSVFREGTMVFSTPKIRRSYSFEYKYDSATQWNLILFEKGSRNRLFSLHRNHLGMTMQDVQDQLFEQSFEEEVWKVLDKHPWLSGLKSMMSAMKSPKFSPELDWHEQVDGLKYYVITRVQQANVDKDAVKHEVYLHKKGKTLVRHIKSRLKLGMVEDIRYGSYKGVDQFYMPHRLSVEFPKRRQRVDVNINHTQITSTPQSPRLIKEL